MTFGSDSMGQLALTELTHGGAAIAIGDLDVQDSLLWDLDIDHELLWDLDINHELLWDLDLIAYGGDGMAIYTPIDIGDTVTLSTRGVFNGEQVDGSNFTLQIKTPDLVQHDDIPGTELIYNATTERYEYEYALVDTYAQAGDHYYRFKVVDEDGGVRAAKWQKLVVRAMPFSET